MKTIILLAFAGLLAACSSGGGVTVYDHGNALNQRPDAADSAEVGQE